MKRNRVLVIDDESNMRHMLSLLLEKAQYEVQSAGDGAEGLALMETSPFDYVLCDVRMPGMDGMTFLRSARERFPQTTFIMMSAYGNLDSAVAAMKEGAYDYVSKPFKSDEILLTLKKADERERLKAENLRLHDRVKRLEAERTCGDMLGDSQPMKRVFELVRRVADHKTTVLITGESGTGKELVAKAVHSAGPRASGPMVSINCGGIPESLLESELFGYRRGAFTNAVRDKPGLFHEADGGTIFLDEIGELPFPLQVKLLRVLQEGEITPLGSTAATKIDIRVIAATARDLRKEVDEGRFREDLFYRIHVMPIHLPPLRERRGDIPLLVGHFLERFNRKLGREVEGLTPEATAALVRYDWPGNVRELENVLERAVLLAGDRWITPAELPDAIASDKDHRPSALPEESLSIKRATRRLESELIRRALEITGGNRSKASRILEISRPVLLSKIRDYGLE